MISLYNNQPNKRIKFQITIEGVAPEKVNSRLIIEMPDKTGGLMINGSIENGTCFFTIPPLVGFEKDSTGIIYYEAIVEEDQYAKLWADQFKVVSKTEIKVVDNRFEEEEPVAEKPKISITQNFAPEWEDTIEEIEEPIEEKEDGKTEEKVNEGKVIEKKENTIKGKVKNLEENLEEGQINTIKETQKDESNIVDFYSFMKDNNKK